MEDSGKSVDSAFHDLSSQDKELINYEESTKPNGKRALPYPMRPGMPDCIYLLRNGSCHFKWQCMFNHPPTRTESQVDQSFLFFSFNLVRVSKFLIYMHLIC